MVIWLQRLECGAAVYSDAPQTRGRAPRRTRRPARAGPRPHPARPASVSTTYHRTDYIFV